MQVKDGYDHQNMVLTERGVGRCWVIRVETAHIKGAHANGCQWAHVAMPVAEGVISQVKHKVYQHSCKLRDG